MIFLLAGLLLQDDVSSLVESLGSDDIGVRQSAETSLRGRLGEPAVVNALERAERGAQSEMAGRARSVLSWVRPSPSPTGIHARLEVQAEADGRLRLQIELSHRGKEPVQVADPEYWNCWPFFTVEAVSSDGSIRELAVSTTRDQTRFGGMPPAAVGFAVGTSRTYADGKTAPLGPGRYRVRVTVQAMEGAKGYDGRASHALPAAKGAVASAEVVVPPR